MTNKPPINSPIRLLVMRFEPHASRLTKQLNAQSIFSLALPLMSINKSIEFIHAQSFFQKKYDYIIAVSGHAVRFSAQALSCQSLNWPKSQYLAVGKSTQQQLQVAVQESAQCVQSPLNGFNSEALLSLPCLQSVNSKKILILRGVGGRECLRDTLIKRGAVVDYYQPYQRVSLAIKPTKLVEICLQNNINGVIISSAELLKEFIKLIEDLGVILFRNITIYAPSQRIIDLALLSGFKKVDVLPCLSDEGLVTYFKQLKKRECYD